MNNNIPYEYKPLSAWSYVGYNILFSLPVVGLILLIIFSFSGSNINRRNYARSFFCTWLLIIIIIAIIYAIAYATGTSTELLENVTQSA